MADQKTQTQKPRDQEDGTDDVVYEPEAETPSLVITASCGAWKIVPLTTLPTKTIWF